MSVELAIVIGQLLIKYGPSVAREFQLLFTKKDPTQEDWDNVFKLAEKPWQDWNKT